MLKKLKHLRSNETSRGTQLQRRVSGYITRKSATFRQDNNQLMKNRIIELEAEVEKLCSTVKFYQDMFLQED